jgi:hypothetical protein
VYIIAGVLSFAFAHRVGVDLGALVPASAASGLKSKVSKVQFMLCATHASVPAQRCMHLQCTSVLQLCAGALLPLTQ